MSKPSRLNENQWLEIEKKNIEGIPIRQLAREYGIAEGQIRRRITAQVKNIKSVANSIVYAQTALERLPLTAQLTAQTLAFKLKSMSDNLASAAHHGAATAHRLSALANAEASKIDDANILESGDAMTGIAKLTALANESSKIAISLLNANKEKAFDDTEEKRAMTLDEFYGQAKP